MDELLSNPINSKYDRIDLNPTLSSPNAYVHMFINYLDYFLVSRGAFTAHALYMRLMFLVRN